MKRLLLLYVLMSAIALSGIPIARSIISSGVTHASASDTRCITATYVSSVSTNINRITLWDTTNPEYPRQGITLVNNNTWGLYHFRQPMVWQNLLLYMDSYVLRIIDISNIDIPVQLAQLPAFYVNCFTVYDHYLVLGTSSGTLDVYDLSNPAQPALVSVTPNLTYVMGLWVSSRRLGVSCGSTVNNTAKTFAWAPATQSFYELASVLPIGKVTYVGDMSGRVVVRRENGSVPIYAYYQGGPPMLVLELSGGYNLRHLLVQDDLLYAYSEDNCLRIWQIDNNNTLAQVSHFDVSHLSLDPGALFELRDNRLVCSVATSICMILDVADFGAVPEFVSNHYVGVPIKSIAIPEGSSDVFYMVEDRLTGLKLDSSGQLSQGSVLTGNGYYRRMIENKGFLYLIYTIGSALYLQVIDFRDPDNHVVVHEVPVSASQIFTIKDDHLYMGWCTEVSKYQLGSDGIPVWKKTFSYTDQESGYDVYILDMVNNDGIDYAVGVYGSLIFDYTPILLYWLPNGTTGYLYPPFLLSQANVANNYLYLTGNGLNVLSLMCGVPRLEQTLYKSNHTRGVESTLWVDDRYLIECYGASNQIRIYALANPIHPRLIHTINLAHGCESMGIIGHRLICASGNYGIDVYELPVTVDVQDDMLPSPLALHTWPNPFQERVNISFTLDKASDVKLECYNIKGQKVSTRHLPNSKAGENLITWDARDANGLRCSPGIYILRLHTPTGVQSRKITLIR